MRNQKGVGDNVILALCVFCFAGVAGWRLYEHKQSDKWPAISAPISKISPLRVGSQNASQFDVDYSYKVGTNFYAGTAHYNTMGRELYDQISSSTYLPIHYNPKDPKDSADPRGWFPLEYYALVGGVCIGGTLLFKKQNS
jgi:hypothetical protein